MSSRQFFTITIGIIVFLILVSIAPSLTGIFVIGVGLYALYRMTRREARAVEPCEHKYLEEVNGSKCCMNCGAVGMKK